MKWHDKRSVLMISTCDAEMKSDKVRERNTKTCVIDYNKWMGDIDLKDQLLQMHLVERKCMHKWYVKLFRRLLNATVLNLLIIYRNNGKANQSTGILGQLGGDAFILRLRKDILCIKFLFVEKKSAPQRRCVVCIKHGRREDTRFYCLQCDVGLWRNVLKPVTQNFNF
jgi:hypothetical protein